VHELSIACELIRLAEEAAVAEGASRILEIGVRIGERSGVVRDALEFAFESATLGTLAEGASLAVEDVPARLDCPVCGRPTAPAAPLTMRCSVCEELCLQLSSGREMDLVRVEFE
jgi:hydrogenase nickel incorporation protein HypA/HybF